MNTQDNDHKDDDGLLGLPTDSAQSDCKQLLLQFETDKIEETWQNQESDAAACTPPIATEHYARLYQTTPVGYLTLNKNHLICDANPAAAKLLGVSQQSLQNTTLDQLIDGIDQEQYQLFIKDAFNTQLESRLVIRVKNSKEQYSRIACKGIEYCSCLPDICLYNDNYFWLEFRSNSIENESQTNQLVLSILDVTEVHKQQEMITCLNEKLEQKVLTQNQALATANREMSETIRKLKLFDQKISEREAQLNAIFNAAVEGIITINLSGYILSINSKVETIFGYQKDDLIDKNITKLIPKIKYDHGKKMGLSGFVGRIREVTGLHVNGSAVPLDLSMAQFTLAGKGYLAVIVRDISVRKLREQRDKQHLDELAHVTRMGLLGELASGIAHEVNQPLTAIVNYTEAGINLLNRETWEADKLQSIMTKTSQQALRAGQIINRMRNLVRANTIHKSTTHINFIINDAIELCVSYLKQTNIQIKLLLADKLPTLNVDSIQIEQVVLNLIKNSIDALSHKSVSKDKILSIQTVLQADSTIEVRIKDNGIGIEQSEQKNILTPFYTTKKDGMGMGLSICRSIIEAHGGMLRFNSLPAKGTTFYFNLPVKK